MCKEKDRKIEHDEMFVRGSKKRVTAMLSLFFYSFKSPYFDSSRGTVKYSFLPDG